MLRIISSKWISLVFCLFFIFLMFSIMGFSSDKLDIEKLIKERVEQGYNVGIVVAVVDKNGTYFYSYGKTSKSPEAPPVTEKTIFPIASITKVFTTLLLADDVIQGRVKLNDNAQQFLSDVVKLPTFRNQQITLEDLATHTSGIPKIERPPPQDTLKKFYRRLSQTELTSPPGKKYEYSNAIGLLGYIAAKVSNKNYEELLQEKIFNPLGMQNTKLIHNPSRKNTKVIGYDASDSPGLPWLFPILGGAGALYSNAEDLVKFVAANIGVKKTNLYPAMQLSHIPIHSQGKPLVDFDFPGIQKLEIGLGWNIDKEHDVIWKNGNFPHYSSFVGFNPKTNRGVVVLANSGNVAYTDNLALHILNPKMKLLPLYKEIKLNKNVIDKFSGKYRMQDNSSYIIIRENKRLKSQHIENNQASEYFNLYWMGRNQFFTRIVDAVFTFFEDEKGTIKLKLKEGSSILYGEKVKQGVYRRHKTNHDPDASV